MAIRCKAGIKCTVSTLSPHTTCTPRLSYNIMKLTRFLVYHGDSDITLRLRYGLHLQNIAAVHRQFTSHHKTQLNSARLQSWARYTDFDAHSSHLRIVAPFLNTRFSRRKKCKGEGIKVKAGGVEGGGRLCRCSVTFHFYCYAHFTFLGSFVFFLLLHNCRRYPRSFPLQVQQKNRKELAANH